MSENREREMIRRLTETLQDELSGDHSEALMEKRIAEVRALLAAPDPREAVVAALRHFTQFGGRVRRAEDLGDEHGYVIVPDQDEWAKVVDALAALDAAREEKKP